MTSLTQEDKDQKAEGEKAVQEQKDKKQGVIAEYAKGNSIVHQAHRPRFTAEWHAEG